MKLNPETGAIEIMAQIILTSARTLLTMSDHSTIII